MLTYLLFQTCDNRLINTRKHAYRHRHRHIYLHAYAYFTEKVILSLKQRPSISWFPLTILSLFLFPPLSILSIDSFYNQPIFTLSYQDLLFTYLINNPLYIYCLQLSLPFAPTNVVFD